MPFVSAKTLLSHAQRECYAVPLFDIFEMTGLEDVVAAAEEKQAPAIIGMYATTFEKPFARAFCAAARTLADHAHVPIALMLDHGQSVEQCLAAVEYGFTDVMYDGSTLDLERNIANTRLVVEAAHAAGVGVEAELGHVGLGREYRTFGQQRKGFTEPDAVERFTRETEVDMLAVAVGTAHGPYSNTPELHLTLLDAIRHRTDIPLVLHGGSGLSEEQFRSVVSAGVTKINVATDLVQSMAQRLRTTAADPDVSFMGMMHAVHETMRERCERYLELFGGTGMADACPIAIDTVTGGTEWR